MQKLSKALRYSALLTGSAFSIIGLGCSKQEHISQYEIAKEEARVTNPNRTPKQQPKMQANPGLLQQTQQFSTPEWTVPSGWIQQSASSMRKGSWLIEQGDRKAEISVLAFPGNVGGDVANINRWRTQIGLASEDAEQLQKSLTSIKVDAYAGKLVSMTNAEESIIGAIIPVGQGTWFFKMSGDKAIVESQRDAFKQFLHSVVFK